MSDPVELSLVVPVYNERENLPILVGEIRRALANGEGKGDKISTSSSSAVAPEPAVPATSQHPGAPPDPYDPRFFNQQGNLSPGMGN